MRIALARSWYEGKDAVTPEMKKGIDEAVRVLKDLGATVEDVVFPDIWDYHICGRVVITAEAHAIHRQEVIETPEKFGYTTRRRFQLGAFLTAEQYLSALRFRRQLQQDTRAAMRGYDLVMAANQWGDAGDLRRAAAGLPLPRQAPAQHAVQRHRPAGGDDLLRLRQRRPAARLPARRPRLRRGQRVRRRLRLRTRHEWRSHRPKL